MGRRLIYGVAECVDENGKLFTHHTVTYMRAEPLPSASHQPQQAKE
jgi:hypothetical protein